MVLVCVWYTTEEPIDGISSTRKSGHGLWQSGPGTAGSPRVRSTPAEQGQWCVVPKCSGPLLLGESWLVPLGKH